MIPYACMSLNQMKNG